MNRFLCLIISSLILSISFFSACSKINDNPTIREREIAEFYEINRINTLTLFLPVIYGTSEEEPEELFKIVHITDAHVSRWSRGNHYENPNNLKEAVSFANDPAIKINAMVSTGDHISNHIATTREDATQFMNNFAKTYYRNDNYIPSFIATGNHDINMLNPDFASYAISKTELYNLLTSKINYNVSSPGKENYYYADVINPMGGTIRFIALDVTDQDFMIYNAQYNAIFSQKQIDWLCHTALKKNMTEHHSVIVLIHNPLPPQNEELANNMHGHFLHNWNMIPEIVEAFRTKQNLTKKYRNRLVVSDSISVDISFNNSPGEFICYLGGHLHTYLDYEVKSSSNSTLPNQLMIIANNMSASEKSATTNIDRSDTGLQNNTFNVYAIDTKKKIIYVTFFGATSLYYPQVLTLRYL